ncbi:uncharacterized protein [Aegilops tauschii subsp. strangulata]|uniref:uncharacterized protein n=1 Tax=Aegilops tauschii subsp. strangulata TaxID=200361 RepID=UPI003CC8B862
MPFNWNDQADEAFQDLKRMHSTTPVLAAPAEKEPLLLYIAVTLQSVGMVMVVECPEKGKVQAVQHPVYYLSEHDPLGEIIGFRDASGRVAKWALELAGHTNLYEPRTTIKSQALADFLVDWTETQYLSLPPDSTHWRMHFDGSKMCLGLGPAYDSDLVVQQCSGEWDACDPNMASYRFLVQKLSGFFAGCKFLHVPHAENEVANTLASSRQSIPPGVSLEHLRKPSVKPSPDSESIYVPDDPAAPQPGPGIAEPGPGTAEPSPGTAKPGLAATVIDPAAVVPNQGAAGPGSRAAAPEPAMVAVFAVVTAPSWALPISEFLENGVLPWTRLKPDKCSDGHAESLVLKCEGCQRFSKRNHQPASALRTIPITWPFAVWGLNMVGPFKTARGGMTHLLVAVDKFTKWTEARPIKKLDGPTAVRFVKDIVVRYGMPNNIITDNDTNFAKGALAQYCSVSGIRLDPASVAHP